LNPTHIANPWIALPPCAPYILSQDEALLHQFHSKGPRDEYQIRSELVPEPYLGKPDAPVVLLNLNPGFDMADVVHHEDSRFASRSRDNLEHRRVEYPFYLLDPSINAPGRRWWDRKLGALIQQFGENGRSIVANTVFCVEFFPYHSKKFNHRSLKLPSQCYSFELVMRAAQRDAVILVMRGKRLWLEQLEILRTYSRLYTASSVQNPTISRANYGTGFDAALRAISACTSPS